MIYHVGIDLRENGALAYNAETKEIVKFELPKISYNDDHAKIEAIFDQIKLQLNGRLGCACIHLTTETHDKICQEKYIKAGLENGFEKVEIIDFETALFFEVMSQTDNFKPEVNQIIWILDIRGIAIWQRINGRASFVELIEYNVFNYSFQAKDLRKVIALSELKKPPNAFFYNKDIRVFKFYQSISLIFCQKLSFEFQDLRRGAFIKARILAGELNSTKFNVESNKFNYTCSNIKTTKTLLSPFLSYDIPKSIETNNEKNDSVGIDFGTTSCCEAVKRGFGIETVALDNTGERLLPAWVGYDEEKEKCGQIVRSIMRNFAKSTIFDVKRIIGKKFAEVEIDERWPFNVLCKNDDDIEIQIERNKTLIFKTPVEVSLVLLKYMKQKVVDFQGKPLKEAVVTIPITFNDNQKLAIFDAAKLAGWKIVHLLPEPVAAIFAYYIDRLIPKYSTLLIFDLGGATLDVCIFKMLKNQLNYIGRSGDPNLGGRDFDNLLINFFEEKLKIVSENMKYKLMLECQKIKETENETWLDKNDFDSSQDGFISIPRKEFESMAKHLCDKMEKVILMVLSQSEYSVDKIDKVLLVGGGCRMPLVKNLLKFFFPNAEFCCSINPDEVVAVGAVCYADYLKFGDAGGNKIRFPVKKDKKPALGDYPRTHVSNASKFKILVKVNTKKNLELNMNISSHNSTALSYKDNFNKGIIAGYKLIKPKKYSEFKPIVGYFNGSFISRANVYISVYSMQNDTIVKICDNYKVKDNRSIIITPNNRVCPTEMGTLD